MKEKVKKFFEENEEAFIKAVEDLDRWDGYLGSDRYYPMECIGEFFAGEDALWVLQRAFFGYDEDMWMTDSQGRKEYSKFNPMRDWFRLNAYGNFVSTDRKDYSSYLDDQFVETWIEAVNTGHASMIEELRGIDE